MLERHTFKALINSVVEIEEGITKLEKTLNCHFDQNWMTKTPSSIIRAIAEGFFEKIAINSLEEDQADTIEELLYHFIYMEDCGNDSEHCKSKLIIIDEGKESEHSISCTNIDELYNAIDIYLNTPTVDFTFNYCHSYTIDELK
jgi:hypothetical protein